MELLIVRHALPVRRENVVDGPADPQLQPDGLRQADLLAEYLVPERLDAIYVSPLLRARQTAAPLAAAQGLEIVIDDGVAEYDKESDTYIPIEELKAVRDPRYYEIMNGDDGVDRATFAIGVIAAIERMIDAHPRQKIAVVCHGGVINAYLCKVLGLNPDLAGFFYPNYTSINRVVCSTKGHRTISTVNETAHLRGTGLPVGVHG